MNKQEIRRWIKAIASVPRGHLDYQAWQLLAWWYSDLKDFA